MEEQKDKSIPEAGLPEALHPEIGNGAALADSDHSFVLRAPDVTKSLENLLAQSTSDMEKPNDIPADPEHIDVAPAPTPPTDAPAEASQKDSSPGDVKADDTKSPSKTVRKKSVTATMTKGADAESEKSSDTLKQKSGKKATISAESDAPKAPKPGKRILKAAKAVKKQQKKKNASANAKKAAKTAESKKAVKKTPVKKTTVKKTTVKKTVVKKTAPKKAAPSSKAGPSKSVAKGQLREQPVLSAFTQWLKALGGAEYVHPYEDDFALHPEKGSLKEVISETYADLLATQGYKERAVEMYRKLMEKYPEKSSFFAAKIEALQ